MYDLHSIQKSLVAKMSLLKEHTQSILDAIGRDEEPPVYALHGLIAVRDLVPHDALVNMHTDAEMQDKVIFSSDPSSSFWSRRLTRPGLSRSRMWITLLGTDWNVSHGRCLGLSHGW